MSAKELAESRGPISSKLAKSNGFWLTYAHPLRVIASQSVGGEVFGTPIAKERNAN